MRYSLVNGERTEAQPGLSGECQVCGNQTISKCGKVKIWHWAHKGKRICDPWWENETEWHRNWKNWFPTNWQEIIHKDQNGEKHIADVKTASGWALEFQHSYLKLEERDARTEFYVKLVWVVDGLRRSRDKKQFFELLTEKNHMRMDKPQIHKIYLEECYLLRDWSGIQAPVFFDFGEEDLWCLLPNQSICWGYIVVFSKSGFINLHNNEGAGQIKNFEYWLTQLNNLVSSYEAKQLREREQNAHNFTRLSYDPLMDLVRKQGYHALRKRSYRR